MHNHKQSDEQNIVKKALDAMRASYKFISMVQQDLEKFNLDNEKKSVNSIYRLYGSHVQKQLKNAGNLLQSDLGAGVTMGGGQ